MTDGSSSAELGISQNPENNPLPNLKPVRLGEYGRALEKIWPEFVRIRNNGTYAADRNVLHPHFSSSFALHGTKGVLKREGRAWTFIPPDTSTVRNICRIGVISSDLEFEGDGIKEWTEEETSGSADFWMPDKCVDSIPDFLIRLRKRIYTAQEYITSLNEDEGSATVMFAFDTSRTELAPLMKQAMRDDQPKDTLWSNQFGNRIEFPLTDTGSHLAIPIGLPANYIEYIVVNEKSSHWQGERFGQLKRAAVCDNHPIPLVSAHTGAIIN